MEWYQPHLVVKYLVYFLLVWFFIGLFSKGQFKTNVILFSMYLVNTFWFKEITASYPSIEYVNQYILNKEFLVGIDVFFGLLLIAINKSDLNNYDFKHFGLIGFLVLCHFMILWHLTMGKSWFTGIFHACYDELIIIIGLLQVWVSRDGIFNAISRIQDSDYRFWFRDIHSGKIHLPRKKRKG